MDRYPTARANFQAADNNMPLMYQKLKAGFDKRTKMLDDPKLKKKYSDHIAATTKFLAVITEEEKGVGGVLATTPFQEP
eukprot:3259213-Amphidinium_carterae.1